MDRTAAQHQEIADEGGRRRVLAGQLRLLEAKRAEVDALRPAGAEPDDGLANDLAGIRFVLRTALLGVSVTGSDRDSAEEAFQHLVGGLRAFGFAGPISVEDATRPGRPERYEVGTG